MAYKTLNYYINKALHRPRLKDGENEFIMYVNTDNASGNMENMESLKKAQQSPIYKKRSIDNYNSPTNIRKVWITGKRVAVQYYTTVKTAKKDGKHYYVKEMEVNLFDILKGQMQYNEKMNRYSMSKAAGEKAEKPESCSIKGNPFSVFLNPYTLNNVEEIYVDYSVCLASDEAKPYFSGLMSMLPELVATQTQYNCVKNHELGQAFCNLTGISSDMLRKRFPRLRLIAMVSRLDEILTHQGNKNVDLDFKMSDIESKKVNWLDLNEHLIQTSNSFVMRTDIYHAGLNTEFNVKDQQYKLDALFLKGLVAEYSQKVKDFSRQKRYGSTEKESEDIIESQMSEEEKLICSLDERQQANVLLLVLDGKTIQEKSRFFSNISKANRDRLMRIAGLKVKK